MLIEERKGPVISLSVEGKWPFEFSTFRVGKGPCRFSTCRGPCKIKWPVKYSGTEDKQYPKSSIS